MTDLHVPSQYSPDVHSWLVVQDDVMHFIIIFKHNIINPTSRETTDNLLTRISTMAYVTVRFLARPALQFCKWSVVGDVCVYVGVKRKEQRAKSKEQS